MITQDFLLELESSLLRSFARASRGVTPRGQREPNFLGSVKFKEEFMKEFMQVMQQRRPVLEKEIVKGGHPPSITENIFRLVEDAVRQQLSRELMNYKSFDEKSFQKVIATVKERAREEFYKNYLG